jgi:regulator of nucleoside diphosphate kinase
MSPKAARRKIYITARDRQRLEDLLDNAPAIAARDRAGIEALRAELGRARTIDARDVPPTVVTMNTRLTLRDLAEPEAMEATLVFPEDADAPAGRLSILSPVGTAILGYAEGDTIEWAVPAGIRSLRIERILFQPEAAARAQA